MQEKENIQLDKIDRIILIELDRNARTSDSEIAKKVRRSRESVRQRIMKLEKEGIISGYHLLLDPTKLGYKVYKMYLKLSGSPKEKRAIHEYLRNEKNIFWVALGDGAWDLGFTCFAKDVADFFYFKNKLVAKFQDIMLEKTNAQIVEIYAHPRKFLGESDWAFSIFGKPENLELSEEDRKILKTLAHHSAMKFVEIAKKIGLSLDSVRRRMKSMEKNGIIAQYRTVIDPDKLGMEFYKTFLHLRAMDEKEEKALKEYVRSHPNILYAVKQVSPWDFELEIMVEDYKGYNKILHEMSAQFPKLIQYTESALMTEDVVFPSKTMFFE